ncbi:MAG: tRNA (N(6)-L-threonylcarbamoyladenosine(37)-C(2))-methylthiotransferase MtaB [Paludibacteraceae bacterium]|nr:tRNA (N(6)-L-threonylcarbamoyladenosine(37)-C(2))-methylthiotransferase MtaB [Paludibacteraceae bacterium]
MLEPKTVAFFTLGCKLNFAESSSIAKTLFAAGFIRVSPAQTADVCVINTCSVTDNADKKCRQAIHKIVKQNPSAYVIVTGCYAQLKPEEIVKIEGVDLVIGANDKFEIPSILLGSSEQEKIMVSDTKGKTPFFHACSSDDRTRHFLKIQDGCDYFCSYCTIPFARGRSRNGKIQDLVNSAKNVAQLGGKEIVLSGVNIGDFGKTTNESFFDLLKALDKVEGIERYRISSIEPNLLTDEIIDFVATSEKFMPHFHIPLQSGSDEVLRLMRRRYTTQFFAEKIEKIKTILPDSFIGIDVIVGMRGETEKLFEETYQFLRNLNFSQLHVFSYSERAGTKALEISHKVSPSDKKQRSKTLLDLSAQKTLEFYQQQQNKSAKVLWESTKRKHLMFGFTENYVKAVTLYDEKLVNTLQNVKLEAVDQTDINDLKMNVERR